MEQIDLLNDQIKTHGTIHKIEPLLSGYQVQYSHPNGELVQGDTFDWLRSIPDNSVDMVFADPPYNIKKASWDNFSSQEEYIKWSIDWISQSARVLKKTGSLYICGFSEILADLKHPASKYFKHCRWLIWYYRNKANLGKDWGRSHESILHLRKSDTFTMNIDNIRIPYGAHTLRYPEHPQATSSAYGNGKNSDRHNKWTPHPLGAKPKDVIEIPTTCNGMGEKTPHPTQKPEELLRKFILTSTNKSDLVLDPFSGSGTTLVVAEQLNRKWMGCDLEMEYNSWAINRIEHVCRKSESEWIAFDRSNHIRRDSIR